MARKKITVTTDNSEWKAPKKRKSRKPMTEEQKEAASERLVKARAAKLEKNPDYGQTNIHESLRKLPDDHQLSPAKVKHWIKVQQDYAKSERAAVRQNVKRFNSKNFLTMKRMFVICRHIFAQEHGLTCSMVNNNRVRFATGVLRLLTTGMAHARVNQKET